MNFIGIDTTMASFTEFYWYRYHDDLSYEFWLYRNLPLFI